MELWSRILAQLADDTSDKLRSVDCTHIKVRQAGANAIGGAGAHAIGSTKEGSNTKLAVVVDCLGRAVGLNLVPGNRHDLKAVNPLIEKLAGCLAIVDREFDAKKFREELIRLDATACIRHTSKTASRAITRNWPIPIVMSSKNTLPASNASVGSGLATTSSARPFSAS